MRERQTRRYSHQQTHCLNAHNSHRWTNRWNSTQVFHVGDKNPHACAIITASQAVRDQETGIRSQCSNWHQTRDVEIPIRIFITALYTCPFNNPLIIIYTLVSYPVSSPTQAPLTFQYSPHNSSSFLEVSYCHYPFRQLSHFFHHGTV